MEEWQFGATLLSFSKVDETLPVKTLEPHAPSHRLIKRGLANIWSSLLLATSFKPTSTFFLMSRSSGLCKVLILSKSVRMHSILFCTPSRLVLML